MLIYCFITWVFAVSSAEAECACTTEVSGQVDAQSFVEAGDKQTIVYINLAALSCKTNAQHVPETIFFNLTESSKGH